MIENVITVERSLAAYWLDTDSKNNSLKSIEKQIQNSAKDRSFEISYETMQKVTRHLSIELIDGDINQWVVSVCFTGHPHTLWNFMLDAVDMANNDQHLEKIATELAEHILAHYGTMIDYFENWAKQDQKFKRMLTGVWRHRMSDDVWMRLRAIQSEVGDPLPNMIPLEHGLEYMAKSLSLDDRRNSDKGPYIRNADGKWQKNIKKPFC